MLIANVCVCFCYLNGVESIYNGSKYIQAVYGWKGDEALLVYRFHWD